MTASRFVPQPINFNHALSSWFIFPSEIIAQFYTEEMFERAIKKPCTSPYPGECTILAGLIQLVCK